MARVGEGLRRPARALRFTVGTDVILPPPKGEAEPSILAFMSNAAPPPGPGRWLPLWLMLGAGLLLAGLVHLGVGRLNYGPSIVLAELLRGDVGDTAANTVIWRLRLPRTLMAMGVGLLLGTTGAAFQAFFRNPLAEPYVLGISSGAAAAGSVGLLLGLGAGVGFDLLLLTAAGAGLTLILVLGLARLRQDRTLSGLLLSGVVLGALLSAGLTLALSAAGQDSGRILRWLLGSLAGANLAAALLVLGVACVTLILILPFGRALNAYAVEAGLAHRLGVPTKPLRWAVLGAGSLAVGISVGAVGIVGFVGLVTPHLVRGWVGSDARPLLVGSALVGPVVVLLADLAAQRLLPVGELPLGAMTALIAAPMLLVILQRSLREVAQ